MEPDWIDIDSTDPSNYCWKEGDECYACSGTFRLRKSSLTKEYFLGCSNYPRCKATSELAEQPAKIQLTNHSK